MAAALQQAAARGQMINGTYHMQPAQVAEIHAHQQRGAAMRRMQIAQATPREENCPTSQVVAQRPAPGSSQYKQQLAEQMMAQMLQASNPGHSGAREIRPLKRKFSKTTQEDDLIMISDDDEDGARATISNAQPAQPSTPSGLPNTRINNTSASSGPSAQTWRMAQAAQVARRREILQAPRANNVSGTAEDDGLGTSQSQHVRSPVADRTLYSDDVKSGTQPDLDEENDLEDEFAYSTDDARDESPEQDL